MTNDDEDAQLEGALFRRLLDLHPTHVTVEEMIRDLAGENADFAARDGIERAVRELSGAGLLHTGSDGCLTPSRAAVHVGRILCR